MRLKYAVAAASAVLASGLACTEPVPVPAYFEGTIKSIWIVKDAFQNTETLYLEVVQSASDPCRQADVTVTDATSVYYVATPLIKESSAAIKAASVVRVMPYPVASDVCPMDISATSVAIVQ